MGIIIGPFLIYVGLMLYMPLLCEHFLITVAVTYAIGVTLTALSNADPYVRELGKIRPASEVC